MEVESLYDAANVLVDFVRTLVGCQEERLLSAQVLIRAMIERDVHRGAIIALMMARWQRMWSSRTSRASYWERGSETTRTSLRVSNP
jgi:hypothetical protein